MPIRKMLQVGLFVANRRMSDIAVGADSKSRTADRHAALLTKLQKSEGLWETEIRQPLLLSSNKTVDKSTITTDELTKLREQFATAANRQEFLEVVKANPLVTIATTLVHFIHGSERYLICRYISHLNLIIFARRRSATACL